MFNKGWNNTLFHVLALKNMALQILLSEYLKKKGLAQICFNFYLLF